MAFSFNYVSALEQEVGMMIGRKQGVRCLKYVYVIYFPGELQEEWEIRVDATSLETLQPPWTIGLFAASLETLQISGSNKDVTTTLGVLQSPYLCSYEVTELYYLQGVQRKLYAFAGKYLRI